MNYYDFQNLKELECPECKWKGSPEDTSSEYFSDLKEVYCPKCNYKFFLVAYPTADEVREAAEHGNESAKTDLQVVGIQEIREEEFEATKLKKPEQLPDIKSKKIDFVWDMEFGESGVFDNKIVVRYDNQVIWREMAFYECRWRFDEVKEILKLRYGKAFRSLIPTKRSGDYLYGDKISDYLTISFY